MSSPSSSRAFHNRPAEDFTKRLSNNGGMPQELPRVSTKGWDLFAAKNVAAWALKPKERPLTVSSAPYTKPPKGHVVIKVLDVAVNPIDWILQDQDLFGLKYPTVFGSDVAGEIAEVGDGVDDLRIGQRVIA